MKAANHSATPKVIFSASLGSIKTFRSDQAHIMHALIPGQRDSENEVNALFSFPESRHCAFHLGGKSLAETFCTSSLSALCLHDRQHRPPYHQRREQEWLT